ncbi:MAG: nucleotidyltransferase family protein [Candidatus Binatia bacterium]
MDDTRRFLRLCLRARRDPAAGAAVRAWVTRGALDWKEVIRVARAGRIAPLLHGVLRNEICVPAEARRGFRRAYLTNAQHNLVLLRELETAIAALDAVGVPSIVLKGGALAKVVYHNIALRTLMDVDLLIHREHFDTAVRRLAQRGFTPRRAETRTGAAGYENELLLTKPGAVPVPLELHWSLFDSPYYQQRLNLDACWRQAVPFALGERQALMLDPVSQLLHLCGHIVLHHGGADLLWENDIAEVVALNGPTLDWSALLDRAAAFDLVIAVQRMLLPLAEDEPAAVPGDILERVRRMRPTADERRIVGYLTAAERGAGRRFRDDLVSMHGWHGRLGYAWTHLVPSAAYMRERYHVRHPLLLPFYYPYRWFRGILR